MWEGLQDILGWLRETVNLEHKKFHCKKPCFDSKYVQTQIKTKYLKIREKLFYKLVNTQGVQWFVETAILPITFTTVKKALGVTCTPEMHILFFAQPNNFNTKKLTQNQWCHLNRLHVTR